MRSRKLSIIRMYAKSEIVWLASTGTKRHYENPMRKATENMRYYFNSKNSPNIECTVCNHTAKPSDNLKMDNHGGVI